MATGIRQVVFQNGEDMNTVNENLSAFGSKLVTVVDIDGKEVYPVDQTQGPRKQSIQIGPGGFTMQTVHLDFDMVIIIRHPINLPVNDYICFAKTEHSRNWGT